MIAIVEACSVAFELKRRVFRPSTIFLVAFKHYDFFISYSREDTDKVRPLVEALRRSPYRVFFDAESIKVGEPWKPRLEASIRRSRSLVLCWSAHAIRSDFIQFEYHRAQALGIEVLPWLLDDTPPPVMIEIQAVTTKDPIEVAAALQDRMGLNLSHWRRRFLVGALVLASAVGWVVWSNNRLAVIPKPQFIFRGHIQDERGDRVAGATVFANGEKGISQPDGTFVITMASDPGQMITLRISGQGYRPKQIDNADFQVPDFGITLEHAK